MWIDEIQTQFVRDRLRETSFTDRTYVEDLHRIEQLQSGRQFGRVFHMNHGPEKLYVRYPAEAECIRLELKEGQYVAPARFDAEYRRLAAAWHAREKAQAGALQQQRDTEIAVQQAEAVATLQRARAEWLRMGGQA